MRILLVLPSDTVYRYGGRFGRQLSYAPLTLTTLAALVPPDLNAEIDIVDEGVQSFDYNARQYDIVGITCVTSSAMRAYELGTGFRRRGSVVIMGGPHVTLNPDEAGNFADIVITGPAEEVWPALLKDLHGGMRVSGLYRGTVRQIMSATVPARHLLPVGRYLNIPTVMASRGCTNACSFCSVQSCWQGKVSKRPVAEVVDEIRALRSRRVLFLDPNLTADREYAMSLFDGLRSCGVRWSGLTTVAVTGDDEVYDLMVRSGCEGVLVGFESINQSSLSGCAKLHNDVTVYKLAMNRFHSDGIRVLGCFVLGFDQDTKATFSETLDFVDESGVDAPRFALLTPFPGTPLYSKLKNEGRILSNDWSLYDIEHVVFEPRNMSADELRREYCNLWLRAYSIGRIVHRVVGLSANRLVTGAVNMGFRRHARAVDARVSGGEEPFREARHHAA